ncbi:hypothetical protein RhiirC2_773708 [Rhizophagus irregularis]|uniref:Uncharacterized protein n=1 Tax=Rhizophagus irregularis TaxID=588596 RepID=A0A2N1NN68_9GLOM|nr:hypothetical protein RhiirC2_773708 [Rhizophagus irregularis]
MTKERTKKILNTIDDDRFLIKVKFVREKSSNDGRHNYAFKIIDKYQPIQESKKAVREVSIESDIDDLTANAVLYGLYRIQEPDTQQVIGHFEKSKREYDLTSIRKQKISTWKKRMRQPGARIEDVAELEKILKRPIKLLDITHRTIFNSKKYRTERFEEIEMVVHNGHTFSRNHHFPRDRMIRRRRNIRKNPVNIPIVLEDSRTIRTWMKHTDIIKAYKELFEDAVDWQFREKIINEEKKQESLKSLKIVELAEQVFGANHARGKLANEINDWHSTPASVHENIKQSCVEYKHGGC